MSPLALVFLFLGFCLIGQQQAMATADRLPAGSRAHPGSGTHQRPLEAHHHASTPDQLPAMHQLGRDHPSSRTHQRPLEAHHHASTPAPHQLGRSHPGSGTHQRPLEAHHHASTPDRLSAPHNLGRAHPSSGTHQRPLEARHHQPTPDRLSAPHHLLGRAHPSSGTHQRPLEARHHPPTPDRLSAPHHLGRGHPSSGTHQRPLAHNHPPTPSWMDRHQSLSSNHTMPNSALATSEDEGSLQNSFFTIRCKDGFNSFALTAFDNGNVAMSHITGAPNQKWSQVMYGSRFVDRDGYFGVMFINNGTGKSLAHGRSSLEWVTQVTTQVQDANLWVLTPYEEGGYQRIRVFSNPDLYMDVWYQNHHSRTAEGNIVDIFRWVDGDNQRFGITPTV